MDFFGQAKAPGVNKRGAAAGCTLRGSGLNNQGLRLKVLQEQARGDDGPIKGDFVILDAGANIHSQSLAPLVDQVTDARAVVVVIRRLRPGCVNVVNANILVPEEP